ncbi:MAG: DUF2436 domain-containing protein [Christensenellales bacterium]
MKKLSKLLCAVLSLMLVLSVSFAPALAETIGDAIEEQTLFTQLDKAWAELDVVQEDLVNSKADAETVVKAIYDAAFECELIDEGSINEYREGIGFTFTVSGLACIYDYRVRVQSDKGYATPNEAVVEAIRTMPSDEDILLIGPYYGIDSSFTNQYKNEANSLAGYTGGNVTILQSSGATATAIVNNYLGKSVVIYDSHGTAGYGTSYLCLTTGTGITSEDLTNQWACSLGGGDYGIDGRYIQNHVNGDLGDCGVWMAICEGMKKSGNGVTGTALLQAGAGFVYGYSQSVTFAGDYKYEKTFWERMRQGDTVAQAFKVMTDTHGVCDPYGDAYPIVMSATDAFPSNPDSHQTVTSDWKLINNGTPDPSPSPTPTPTSVPDPEVPEGYALVKLTAGDVWGDGSGYQMLIDADATAYGTIIPVEGGLTNSGNAPAGLYDNFEYKIPENADGSLTTTNIIINNTGSVLVPAGTYDWAITNPTPGDRIWIASSNNSECPGRYDNYTFEAGKTYEFKVKLQGQNDWVDVVISDGGDTPTPTPTPGGDEDVLVGWYFESQSEVNEWTFVDKDGDGYNWDWNELGEAPVAYEGAGCIYSNSYVNYDGAVNPDNWAISPEFTIPANAASATLSWYAGPQDPDWVAEHYGVYVGTGTDTANYTQLFEETINYSDYKNTTVDLTAYAGQTIRVAFRHFNCTDMFILKLDQVEVMVEEGVEPTPGGEELVNGWYFESQSEVNEWTFVDKDGDGYNWDWNELGEAPVAYEGAGCIYSNSYVNYDGAVNPDNWAISPEFTIPANAASATLSWYAGPQDPDWVAEHYGVYVGTGTDTANYTQLFEETINYSDYKNTTVDLTAYAGQTIRVAFRHFNCSDMFILKLDQVEVFATVGEEPVEEYTVTFVDGLTGETIDTQTVVAGEDAVAPEAPVHEGYSFVEWDTDFTNVQSDLTVTAVYAINEYTVTFVDGLTGETIDTQTVEHGADAVEPAVPEHVGYHFVGWDVDFTNVTSDLTVTALYEINKYNVHIRTTSCGTASPIGDIVVEHGDDLTINMTPDANHYVWYVTINGEIVAVRPGNVITINDITEDLDIFIVFNTDAPEVTPPTPAPTPSTPPKTGAISMTAIAIMAIVSGAGIMFARKK